ncbi:MAG: YicC family protein [Desulfarculaceae bacterium]|nr:YicC family protein [Desulfarculaceae bacterium]
MIHSMTAYAQAEHTIEELNAAVSIRTYNSRNLDTVVFLPESLRFLEDGIKKGTAARLNRGRVEIRVSVENPASDSVAFRIDEKRAESYIRALHELGEKCGVESDITLELLLSGRDMIVAEEKEQDQDAIRQVVSQTLEITLDRVEEMRKQEGSALAADLEHRLELIENRLSRIEQEAEAIPAAYKERLEERIATLTGNAAGLDAARIAQEAAILADKSDISEELVRAKSHIQQARQIIASDEPGGRKLNFLVQEFNREFNTMGSKSPSAVISQSVVELKSELEKVREQVQNIE